MIRAFFAVLLTAYCLLPTVSYAQSVSDLQAQINIQSQKINALKAEIERDQQQLDVIGAKKSTLQSTISTLVLSQKQLAAHIKITQAKIASANLQIQQLSLSIGNKESSIVTDQVAIAKALRTIAEEEERPFLIQLVSAHTLGEAWQIADQAVQFNRALGSDIDHLRATRLTLATNRDQVSAKKTELVKLTTNLTLQKKSIDLQKSAQQKLLADTKNQESSYQKIVADKKAEEARFEATLFELESQLQYVLDPKRIPPAGRGVLRWPLSDVFITQQFGRTSSSQRLYLSGTHNGVDFRASIGTPIRSVLSGIVLAINYGAVQNCQYGKWVLIKHSNGLATLYAHLSDISIQKGDAVSTGQVIGFAGNTGYSIGSHLHLSVYLAEAISFKDFRCWNGALVNIPIAPINAYLDPLSYL